MFSMLAMIAALSLAAAQVRNLSDTVRAPQSMPLRDPQWVSFYGIDMSYIFASIRSLKLKFCEASGRSQYWQKVQPGSSSGWTY